MWIKTCEDLRSLTVFFEGVDKRANLRLVDLYQRVQYTQLVLPRLYLMCTVGSVFVMADKTSAKEVLQDMLAMMTGVQHPTRGLFLRHYLNQVTRGRLGALGDAVARCKYLQENFEEMTKLWVRMGHQDTERQDPQTREAERRQLKQLVGTNLSRLVEETEDDASLYESTVLPGLIKVVETCSDAFAQTYLLEITTHIVPNDAQMRTLPIFLSCVTSDRLAPGVDVRLVLVSLMSRLCTEPDLDFAAFEGAVAKCSQRTELGESLQMYAALAKVAMSSSGQALQRVDGVMHRVTGLLSEQAASAVKLSSKDEAMVVDVLMMPLKLESVHDLLGLKSFAALARELSPSSQATVASSVVQMVVDSEQVLPLADVESFLDAVEPAIKNNPVLLAKALFRIGVDEDKEQAVAALRIAQARMGVVNPGILLPALVARFLTVAPDRPDSLQAVHELCSSMAALDEPHNKLKGARCFLLGFQAADKANMAAQAEEFMIQALTIFEETPDSRAQAAMLPCFVGALQRSVSLADETLEGLEQKTAIHAAGLLRKPDQVRAILQSAHLFWTVEPSRPPGRNSKRTLECLQRALKVADLTPQTEQLGLFVEILNAYIFFLRAGADKIKASHVSSLIVLMRDKTKTAKDGRAVSHFAATLEYIRQLQQRQELKEIVVGGPLV